MLPETGSVLLVDDDPAVRQIITRYLQRKGVQITDSASGEDAWLNISRSPSRIQLLITDMVMPGISGADLVRRVRGSGYQFPIILISGYSDQPPESCEDVEFMAKPIDFAALAARINELIETTRRGAETAEVV